MRVTYLLILCLVACLSSHRAYSEIAMTRGVWDGDSVSFAQGRAILTLKSDGTYIGLSVITQQYSISVEREYPSLRMYFLAFPTSTDVIEVCNALNADPNTHHCCPDFEMYPLIQDRYWNLQWGFRNTGQRGGTPGADMMAAEALAITSGILSVKIGVLDTGIPYDDASQALDHPDLQDPSRIDLGCLCYNGPPWTFNDVFGHGTATAGVAAAAANAYGTIGMCPECGVVVEKIMHSDGPTAENMIDAIHDAEARGVRVVNLSFFTEEDVNLTAVIDDAGQQHDMLFTFACGNFNTRDCVYPARLAASRPFVIAVSGTNPADSRWRYWEGDVVPPWCAGSNYGPSVTVAAPAGGSACPGDDCMEILTSLNSHELSDLCGEQAVDRVAYMQGTSLAAPAVAGIAGLLLSYSPGLTNEDLRNIIEQSADHVYGTALPIPNDTVGYGRVNAFKALLRAPGVKTLSTNLTVRPHIYDAYSPYYVEEGLIVPSGVTMTLQPGVRLTFGPNAFLEVHGNLVVSGTMADSIRFEAANPAQPWQGLHVLGGQAQISYAVFKDATLPFFSESAGGPPTPIVLTDARIIGGVNAIRIWGSPFYTHLLRRVIAQDVPNITNYAALYFLNALVMAEDLTVENSGYRTGYLVGTYGKCTRCSFHGPTANYGLAISGANSGMVFRCSKINHIAPVNYPGASVWCLNSAAPVFGDEPIGSVMNNSIEDNSSFLIRFAGTGGRPVVGSRLNRLEQENLGVGGRFFIWTSYAGGAMYGAKTTYWGGVVPQIQYFDPALPTYWDWNDYRTADPGLCPSAGPLDDGTMLDSALSLEQQERWEEAQAAYLAIVSNATEVFSVRVSAAARAVMVNRMTGSIAESQMQQIAEGLESVAGSLADSVVIERIRLCHMADQGAFETALQGHLALLDRGLDPEDSLLTVIDLLHVQLLAGNNGGGLDDFRGMLRPGLAVTSQESGVALVSAAMDSLIALHRRESTREIPTAYTLYQNYPNPFNPTTEINFDLPEAVHVELKIYNTLGQLVTTLLNESRPAGAYRVAWDGSGFASGLYVYQLKAGHFTDSKKMMLLK